MYDEQPVGFKQSWSQRARWTIGHILCLKEYTKSINVQAIFEEEYGLDEFCKEAVKERLN